MKRLILFVAIFCSSLGVLQAQAWMNNLDFAKRLALTQNKMLFVMWESSTMYPLPVRINDAKGQTYLVENLFESEELNRLIWEHFVPVSINEDNYEAMYDAIESRRSQDYLDKFNDDSIKIMDANGMILNMSVQNDIYLNLSEFIARYALDTSFLSLEQHSYAAEANFYNAFYLSSKYLDYTMFANEALRPELMALSMVYLNEARAKIKDEDQQEQAAMQQRSDLLELESFLLKDKPRKVLRKLRRLDADEIAAVNTEFVAFLYYTAYRLIKDIESSKAWMGQVSSVNLKKSDMIVRVFF
ncbi:hypothetical protein ESY86_19305 [Subsaximicrobium wynnwilliamsii]|uniref:Uncharacterized protein n=1 Tax=Subsaximicrobium wynnwilliamsii TaxID=291179 RepID=A0A5C6ZAP6_9FLAO|nr:hypothetical protein [Subsaximicrobium wynnwilliamsii]TXD81084.1 hypothetical protein ESY87_19330 [Subsaximicrobium wynnwilliamsii]TXD86758.1 hypothetical protein ESY86_19305 [Subsaximicrobium wynnwilliamsii]TXE00387.1 hypothetical protein ESY88_19395 [Subsaximicrobium wynnwilliamsii]